MAANKRYAQADREAWITLALYCGYFVWWYAFAYGLGGGPPDQYTYVFGFPAWFFYSCILGYPLLSLALWVVVHLFFKDIPLDTSAPPAEEDEESMPPSVSTGTADSAPGHGHGR